MPERLPWSKVVIEVDPHPERSLQLQDGREIPDSRIAITEAAREKMRAGYMCANCLEQFEEAFPEFCPLCRFPVREQQGDELAKKLYVDHDIVTPGVPLDREYGEMERQTYRPKGYVTMSIPKSRKRPK